MQIVEGSVVRATAGRDKGGFLRSSDSMARARYFQTAGAVSSKRPKKEAHTPCSDRYRNTGKLIKDKQTNQRSAPPVQFRRGRALTVLI